MGFFQFLPFLTPGGGLPPPGALGGGAGRLWRAEPDTGPSFLAILGVPRGGAGGVETPLSTAYSGGNFPLSTSHAMVKNRASGHFSANPSKTPYVGPRSLLVSHQILSGVFPGHFWPIFGHFSGFPGLPGGTPPPDPKNFTPLDPGPWRPPLGAPRPLSEPKTPRHRVLPAPPYPAPLCLLISYSFIILLTANLLFI